MVIKMDASVNHAVRSLECLRFMCRLLPAAKCVVFFMDIHSYIKYTVHRGLPLYAVIPVTLPSIVSIQVNPRPYNGEVTSYYLILQISISADRDAPAFFESGDIFPSPILKKRQRNVRCIVEGFLKISRSFFRTKGKNMSVCYMEGKFFALPPHLQKFCPLESRKGNLEQCTEIVSPSPKLFQEIWDKTGL